MLLSALDRPETLRSHGAGVVSFADPGGTVITLTFDAKTHLLSKAEVVREHATAGDTTAEILYLDYRKSGEVLLPARVIERVAGLPTEETRITAFELNADMPAERFRPPERFVAVAEDPPAPRVEPLGDGLYLIRGAYNVLFAAFGDHVVVFEAPLNSRYAAACLDLVRKTLPTLPIRSVVATHFHYDHVAGLRPYIARSIPIVTSADAKGVIERVARSRRQLHPDELSAAPAEPRVETVAERRVLEDGTQRAELYDVGPTDHVTHILAAYFPRQKLLFEADLFDPVSTELTIAGIDAAALYGKIRELGLDVERIIPVHGIPITMGELERGLEVHARYARSQPPTTDRRTRGRT